MSDLAAARASTLRSFGATFAAGLLLGSVALAVYLRLFYGIDFSDESYYAALPYSFGLGHRPLEDELAVHHFAGLMLAPAVKLYVSIVGSHHGLILFLRHVYFGYALLCVALITRSLARGVGTAAALAISACALAYVPFHIPALSYYTLASLGLLAGLMLVAFCSSSRRPNRDLFSGTLFLASAAIAYPPALPAALAAVVASVLLLRHRSGRAALGPAAATVALAGALAGGFVAGIVWRYDGLANLPRLLALDDAMPAQGGGLEKLSRILREGVLEAKLAGAFAAVLALAAFAYRALGRRWAAILALAAVGPLLYGASSFYQPFSEPYSTGTFLISLLGLASPLAIWRLQRSPLGRSHSGELWIVSGCSLLAGACIVWASANGLRSAALGLLPAALVGLAAFAARPAASEADETLPRLGSFEAIALLLLFMVGMTSHQILELYRHVYRDAPISQQVARVRDGAWAGISTTGHRSRFIEQLEVDLEGAGSDARTVLFFDYFPAGYLFGSLRPRTPALWMFPPDPRYQGNDAIRHEYARYFVGGRPLPDLVVRMKEVRIGQIRAVAEPAADPVRRRFAPPLYQERIGRRAYSILERRHPPAAAARPNLILVSIDTLRADHVGAYGYPRPTTPNIDALARDAVLFEDCVAHAPTTLASHGSMLTSLLPRHHGASISRMTKLADHAPTLAETLREEGYDTASFNGGLQLDRAYGLDRGFVVYDSMIPRLSESWALGGTESRTIERVRPALRWMSAAGRPFFLFLHSYEIHHPYTPSKQYREIFDRGYAGKLPDRIPVELLRGINFEGVSYSEADLEHIVDLYDAELRSADDALGVLLDFLHEHDLYDDTMIIVTSDHGEEFGEHGKVGWHSHTLYEELLRVPLIVKYPASEFAGAVVGARVRGIDLAPTALAGLGIALPSGFSGRDLGTAITEEALHSPPTLSMFDLADTASKWALRSADWKLESVDAPRLFDLSRDPAESWNLAEQHPRTVEELREVAAALLAERVRPEDVSVRPPKKTIEQLRELGYIE